MKISLKKYSNISVFEKRHENKLFAKNIKKYVPLKLYNIKKKLRIENELKKKNSEINDIIYSFYIYQTSESNETQNFQSPNNSNIAVTSLFSKTSNNFKNNSFPFYLTQTETTNFITKINPKKKKMSSYTKFNDNIIQETNQNNLTNDFIFSDNYKTYNKLNDYFQKKGKKMKKNENNKTYELIDRKLMCLRDTSQNNYNSKEFINKTRKLMLMKYDSLMQKEIKSRLEEKNENAIDLTNEKIYSLNNMLKLHKNVFENKLTDYIRFISNSKDTEEKNDLGLVNQIYSLKREISNLMNKIRKVQIEKNNIIQWILLQIKVKEKQLVLPSYYQKLLELSMPKIDKQRRMAKANINMLNREKNKKFKNIRLNKEKISLNSDNSIVDIDEEKYNEILFYRRNLIFQTPEDFIEEIKNIENKNLKLFGKIDILMNDIKRLKRKYNDMINSKDSLNSSLEFLIKKGENELQQNKNGLTERKKIITNYKNIKNNDNEIAEESSLYNSINSKLIKHVEKLFLTSKKIIIKKGIFNFKYQNNLIMGRANKNKEELILDMLEFIEVRISYLLNEFLLYKNPLHPAHEYIKQLRMNYTKRRNIEKSHMARIEKKKKNLKLFEKINTKKNQIVYLNKNKKALSNFLGRLNIRNTRKKIANKKIYIPKIDDFLFGDNDKINVNK